MSPGSHDGRGAAHLLGKKHGPVWQLGGFSARLLPHGHLLGQELLPLWPRTKEEDTVGNNTHSDHSVLFNLTDCETTTEKKENNETLVV